LQAINHAGGTVESEWPLERALRIGDEATQGRTLTELYRKMATQPFAVDLDKLWEQLGVGENGGRTILDDPAPLAGTRKAIFAALPLRQELKSMTEIRVELQQFQRRRQKQACAPHSMLIDRPHETGELTIGFRTSKLYSSRRY
jgi:hypothetical protein